jgi:PAS domain S-box-containing protein
MHNENPTQLRLSSEVAELRRQVAELQLLNPEGPSAAAGLAGEPAAATEKLRGEALRFSESRYRRLFEAAQDGILILDAETGQIADANPFLTDLLGYSHADLVGKTLWEIGPFKNVEASRMAFAELQSNAYIRYEDLPLEARDGRRIDVEFVSNIYFVDGKRVIQCNIRDITARIQGEKIIQLRLLFEFAADHSLEELLQKALDEIGQMTGSPSTFYLFVEENQKTLSLQASSGRTQPEFGPVEGGNGRNGAGEAASWDECVRRQKPVIRNDAAAWRRGRTMPGVSTNVIRELVVPTVRAGRVVAILGIRDKPSDYDDKDVELVAYITDVIWTIAEHKQAQEAQRRYAEQLEAQNTELDAFAHTVAHDLKNPLCIVMGTTSFLMEQYEDMSPGGIAEALGLAYRASRTLNTIIDELMLLTGVRKLEVLPKPIDMNSVVREALNQLQVLIEDQQAEIIVHDETAWPEALGHAPWIEAVWANYISNAVKYGGRPPRIELGAMMQGNGQARFWVRDNGAGLSKKSQAALFIPFTQLAQARTNGHGLGLSIVRRIVEKSEGQVGLTSKVGRGSTFFFTLPASR